MGPSISDDLVYLSQSRTSPCSAVGTKPRLNQPDKLDSAGAAAQLPSSRGAAHSSPRRAAAKTEWLSEGAGREGGTEKGRGRGRGEHSSRPLLSEEALRGGKQLHSHRSGCLSCSPNSGSNKRCQAGLLEPPESSWAPESRRTPEVLCALVCSQVLRESCLDLLKSDSLLLLHFVCLFNLV